MVLKLFSTLFLVLSSPFWVADTNSIPGEPFIIVNKKTNEVAYINENEVKTVLKAATGKTSDLTPEGIFTVTVKAEKPYYRKKNIKGGDPNNPLGTRWIGFDARNTDGRIYGIHGTNNPTLIGQNVSGGCIRLRNEDIELLYPSIPLGTKILITSSIKSFYELASEYGAIK